MTFTDEPSIMWHGKVGVRIENIVVCEEKGAGSSTHARSIWSPSAKSAAAARLAN